MNSTASPVTAGETAAEETTAPAATETELPAGDRNATFVFGYTTPVDNLDPVKATSSFSYLYFNPLYDSLITRGPDGALSPGIAEEWELSEDGATFTLQLAGDRTFHDGTPIDAAAVIANLERVRDDPESTIADLDNVTDITADGDTVVLTVERQGGRLPAILSDRAGMMIAPSTFGTDAVDLQPIGSGPFTLDSFQDVEVTYSRWDGYHDVDAIGPARLDIRALSDDNTRISALISGQLDAALIRSAQVQQVESGGLAIERAARNFVYSLSLNTTHPALAESDVRKAISHAIDRDGINAAAYAGDCPPSVQPYPVGFWANNPDVTMEEFGSFDLGRARELLSRAGYPDGFDVQIGAPNISTYTQLLEIVQGQLGEAGIRVTPVVQESAQFAAEVSDGLHEAWIGPVETGRPDVLTFWQSAYLPGGAGNPGDYSPPGFVDLFDQAAETADVDEQAPIIHDMVASALDNGARVITVCAPDLIFGVAQNVQGVEIPIDGNYSFRGVTKAAG